MAGVPTEDDGALEYGTDAQKVEAWRLKVLLDAGYPVKLAEKIARSGADLHRAVELLEHGCTLELAADILL